MDEYTRLDPLWVGLGTFIVGVVGLLAVGLAIAAGGAW